MPHFTHLCVELDNADLTGAAALPNLDNLIPNNQNTLAQTMRVDPEDISIKATTTEKLGFTGREEGIAAYASVLIIKA